MFTPILALRMQIFSFERTLHVQIGVKLPHVNMGQWQCILCSLSRKHMLYQFSTLVVSLYSKYLYHKLLIKTFYYDVKWYIFVKQNWQLTMFCLCEGSPCWGVVKAKVTCNLINRLVRNLA